MSQKSPTIETRQGVTCILLGPEFENLDEQSLDMIRQTVMDAAFEADPPKVIIDLQHTKFFGSSFIEVLFRIWNRIDSTDDGRFAISGLTDYCREVLEVTHLDKLWKLHSSIDDAIAEMNA